MLSRRKIWLNGKLVPFNKAQVHLLSHSFGRGSALFEVMSVHPTRQGPAIFRVDEHINRLKNSAKLSWMKLPFSARTIKQAIKETVKANQVNFGLVKLICYYSGVELEVVPRHPQVSMAVVALDMNRDLKAERFDKESLQPARVTISRWRKLDPRTVPVQSKCAGNYLGGMVAKMEALSQGFTAPLLLDLQGYVAEGATESFFMVKNHELITPALGNILEGITRKTVLQVAEDIGLKTREKKIRPKELETADEAFFTSSVVKLWPVSRIDNILFYPVPGEITRLLDRVLEKITTGKAKDYRSWLTVVKSTGKD